MNGPVPPIRWSFSIVRAGSAGTFTTTSLDFLVPVPSLPSIVATFVHVPVLVRVWVHVKVVDPPTGTALAPGPPEMPSQFGVGEVREFQRDVAGVPDDDLVFDDIADLAREFFLRERPRAPDSLHLFDRVGRFVQWRDFDDDFVGFFAARAFVAHDGGRVRPRADSRERVRARERRRSARRDRARPGSTRDVFAVGVREVREFQRDVAGVRDDDLVFDDVADFAREFFLGERSAAPDSLELFDGEGRFRFGRDFDDDFVGFFAAGAFIADDAWRRSSRCRRS